MNSLYDSGPEYDALAIGHNAGSEARFYVSFVPPGGTVLELACGTGRLTVPLAECGLNIIGLDNSDTMLDFARAKAAARGISPAFFFGDMREFV